MSEQTSFQDKEHIPVDKETLTRSKVIGMLYYVYATIFTITVTGLSILLYNVSYYIGSLVDKNPNMHTDIEKYFVYPIIGFFGAAIILFLIGLILGTIGFIIYLIGMFLLQCMNTVWNNFAIRIGHNEHIRQPSL